MPPGFVPHIPLPIRDYDDIGDPNSDAPQPPIALPTGARPPPPNRDPADWECPNIKCRNINFKKRTKCNLCGSARADQKPGEATNTVPLTIQGPPGLFKAGDWACPSCGNVNWDWRDRCNICNNLKPELQDKREGGRGGGYFDRQDPQDKKAWDSDEEIFDEFGRKKKKGKGVAAKVATSTSVSGKGVSSGQDGEMKGKEMQQLNRPTNNGGNSLDRNAARDRERGGDRGGDRDRERSRDRGDRGSSRRFDDRERDRGDRDRYDRGGDRGDGYRRRDRDRDR